ncbi:hypothetical protein CNR22_20430 [Sphingobacteriaceae bacterium]|nr:hypothetical protein CNR22_20430 [Sphingobacteriaceae bacterium]
MKKISLIVLFTFLLSSFFGQVKQNAPKQATKEAPKTSQKKYQPANTQAALVNKLLHDTCLDKKFSVVFYLIQDTTFNLLNTTNTPIIQAKLNSVITILNNAFSNICVSFEYCKLVVIPDYNYDKWKPFGNGQVAMNNYYMENTLGIYLPNELVPALPDVPENNYAYTSTPATPTTPPAINGIVVQYIDVAKPNALGFKGEGLLHAMGHFFGLPHTYAEINPGTAAAVTPQPPTNVSTPIGTREFVNRINMQNCEEHGDGFCDTEADPYPSVATTQTFVSATWNCSNTKGLKDGHGDFYLPPCDNLMSHYGLRCRFTQQQYNYMAYFILKNRMYLH